MNTIQKCDNSNQIELKCGSNFEILRKIEKEKQKFDLIVIDGDKIKNIRWFFKELLKSNVLKQDGFIYVDNAKLMDYECEEFEIDNI